MRLFVEKGVANDNNNVYFIDAKKNIISAPDAMADMLACQYSSVFSTPRENLPEPGVLFPEPLQQNCLNNIVFSKTDIEEAIDEVSNTADL